MLLPPGLRLDAKDDPSNAELDELALKLEAFKG